MRRRSRLLTRVERDTSQALCRCGAKVKLHHFKCYPFEGGAGQCRKCKEGYFWIDDLIPEQVKMTCSNCGLEAQDKTLTSTVTVLQGLGCKFKWKKEGGTSKCICGAKNSFEVERIKVKLNEQV